MTPTEKLLHKNIGLWAKTSPKSALIIPYVDRHGLKFCKTERGEPNLRKEEGKKGAFLLHSSKGAVAEATAWFSSLSLRDVSLLCVYGVGLGYYYEAAQVWVK